MAAAYWTGARHGYWFTDMVGFLPPHYGYSAYAEVPLLFLARWRGFRWLAAGALLLSRNRASQVGAIAGWAWAGGARRRALAVILALTAVIGGLMLKPYRTNDAIRINVWKAALTMTKMRPEGLGAGQFAVGVNGFVFEKAHSDVLQLLVEHGVVVFAYVLSAFVLAFSMLIAAGPRTPAKAVVVALTAQSVIDNRLHHPACAALYAAAWLLVWLDARGSAKPSPAR